MNAEPSTDLDLAWRALADPNRRAILAVVRTGPRPVGQIAGEVGLSQQTASHHLGVLLAAGLAHRTKDGTRHLFAVNTDGLAAVRSYLDDFWPTTLAALKTAVESRARTGGPRVGPGQSPAPTGNSPAATGDARARNRRG